MANADDKQSLLNDLLRHETAVWEALVQGDAAADRAALAENFLGVYPDGFADREDHVGQLANGPSVATYKLSHMQARPLGGAFALLSYRAEFIRAARSETEAMYVSSIWQRVGDGWVNVFSQDTPAQD